MKVWIGNLGKYNEGYLVGNWLELPKSEKEINDFLRNVVGLQLTQTEVDKALATDGVCYEEWFIADYDEVQFTTAELGEYTNLESLNLLAAYEDKCNDFDAVNAYCDVHNISDIQEICNVVEQQDKLAVFTYHFTSHLNDNELKAHAYIDEMGVGFANFSDEDLARFIDYAVLGRSYDIDYEAYEDGMPDTAGEYYCGNAYATEYEIGVAVENMYGVEGLRRVELEDCFDYEQYGKDYVDDLFEVIDNGFDTQKLLYVSDNINETLYTRKELLEEVSDVIEADVEAEQFVNDVFEALNETNQEANEPDICDD